jgi:protein-S-isoprenylcysteine O-methyltransferase Ste14
MLNRDFLPYAEHAGVWMRCGRPRRHTRERCWRSTFWPSASCTSGCGAALMSWARVWFASWRFRAKVDASHQLATGGPFALLRHPIYMGLNLLALGSAVWDPTLPV